MLGVIPEAKYTKTSIVLEPGECLFLYTDGVTEAMNKEHHLFCDTRLEEHLASMKDAPLDEMTHGLSDVIEKFTLSYPQHDDITTLAVRYNGAAG